MSTRHVWSYSDIVVGERDSEGAPSVNVASETWIACTSRPVKNSNGYYEARGSTSTLKTYSSNMNTGIRVDMYPYIVGPNLQYYYHAYNNYSDAHATKINYYVYTDGFVTGWSTINNAVIFVAIRASELYDSAGSVISNVSSASSDAYPNNGVSGSYWYKYLGSDNIDPISITYPTSLTLEGTDTKLPYEIKPSTSNIYGGTIEYKKDSKKNGGEWNSSTSDWKTTVTGSYSGFDDTFQTYQLRVHVRDGWGFESTTYVTGPVCTFTKKLVLSLEVSPPNRGTVSGAGEYPSGTSVTVTATPADGWEFVEWQEGGATASTSASYTFTITASCNLTAVFKQKLTAWIGVSGKARKGVELYVGVNGKARKVTGAWIGVNGKARRFL